MVIFHALFYRNTYDLSRSDKALRVVKEALIRPGTVRPERKENMR